MDRAVGEQDLTAEQLAEQFRRLKVSDLVLSTASTVAQLGFAKLDPAGRDLEQAELAIETLRALVPVLERGAGDEVARDFRQVVANLQLAYTEAAAAPSGEQPEASDSGASL